jgi:hypothetical protein
VAPKAHDEPVRVREALLRSAKLSERFVVLDPDAAA